MAVLQGWSKADFSGRLIGMAFLAAFGVAAGWGVRVLFFPVR